MTSEPDPSGPRVGLHFLDPSKSNVAMCEFLWLMRSELVEATSFFSTAGASINAWVGRGGRQLCRTGFQHMLHGAEASLPVMVVQPSEKLVFVVLSH